MSFEPGHNSPNMDDFVREYVGNLTSSLQTLDAESLGSLAARIEDCIQKNRTIFLLGNGGSSATPSHSAADWTKELGARCMCLTDNAHIVTAISNDIDYESIFVVQLRSFMSPADLVIGYSGSGNSENVIRAVQFAKEGGAFTVGMTGDYKGKKGGRLAAIADLPIVVQETSMERIEDCHLILNHIVKEYLKVRMPKRGGQ